MPTPAPSRGIVYCIVPEDLAGELHEPLRKHFADVPAVEVIVETRCADRRVVTRRRAPRSADDAADVERRQVRRLDGRRVAQRRAQTFESTPLVLPRKARAHAARLLFLERLEPSTQQLEDADSGRLVTRFQAGERDAFATLYMRYFDRVYNYSMVVLHDRHGAEDLAQQVFAKVLEALPRYESRGRTPFRAWLFTIARNEAVSELRRRGRHEVTDPEGLDVSREEAAPDGSDGLASDWLTDRELALFVERLPLAQRQVLILRYMLGFSYTEISTILERSVVDVRTLNSRGLRFLRTRLTSINFEAAPGSRNAMRSPVRWRRVTGARRWALHA